MTLMDTAQLLGNFGEFFGAIAVVATLGYLAVQIRQNSNQMQKRRFGAGLRRLASSSRLLRHTSLPQALRMGAWPSIWPFV
jgi:hypothetical protein